MLHIPLSPPNQSMEKLNGRKSNLQLTCKLTNIGILRKTTMLVGLRFVIITFLLMMICNCAPDETKNKTQGQTGANEWVKRLKAEAVASKANAYHPPIQKLADLIESDSIVRMHVTQMIEQVPEEHRIIDTPETLLQALNLVIRRAPEFNDGASFPMSTLFTHMMYTPAGVAAFRNTAFNNAIRDILQDWCHFLDSRDSLYVINRKNGWLSPEAWEKNGLSEFVIPNPSDPHGGFKSFNDYFHRQIKAETRPIASPDDPKVIVSSNDGTLYHIARGVKKQDRFWIKSQPYSLVDMLNGSPHTNHFVGGDVFQSFLSGKNFHRVHAPIDGTIREVRVVDGLMFSELRSRGFDASAGTLSQRYEASVNTRGLLIIESDDPTIGLVCVMPIGITEISSVTMNVKKGQKVKKGEEVGYFSYGGSSVCLIFQPGAIHHYTVKEPKESDKPDDGPKISVNAQIAQAN